VQGERRRGNSLPGVTHDSQLRRVAPVYSCLSTCTSYYSYTRVDRKTRTEGRHNECGMDHIQDQDSDGEDDPTKLLDHWLGELNTLGRGLDNGVRNPTMSPRAALRPQDPEGGARQRKQEYRCSLINLDTSQDDELDAILGELTVLQGEFETEIEDDNKRRSVEPKESDQKEGSGDSALSPISERSSSNMTDLGIHSASHSRSSSGSDEIKQGQGKRTDGGVRTDSPDTDSAFCDNLSVLSSCSTASSNKTGQSINVPSSLQQITKEEQDARIKAEKIKIAIEKIKEASVKKLFIKVFTCDGSAKSLLVDEKMTVGGVTRILAEKNHVSLDPKWALVELVPDLYMERVYEDNELLVENCLLWKVDSKNTLWFIERPEKFDLFSRPEIYLLSSSSSQKDDAMEEHSRQELLEEYFSSSGVGAPQVEGLMWLKADSKKSWKKFYFVLRTSGLYYAPKGKKTSKDLVCLTTFDVNQVYYGVGWKAKYKAPTEYCFGIKHPQIQAKNPKYIKYLCVDTQKELHEWVTGIRIAKNGRHLFDNYRGIVEEITHADIDILTSKRFSINSSTGLKNPLSSGSPEKLGEGQASQAVTPSSENKSLASALSSGIESDMSQSSSRSKTMEVEAIVERPSPLTPQGTLDRSFNLRRSFSRSSRSSSSSGCLSDNGGQGGFDADFPAGGTIKKRPTATARLPLTNTTWGLVRESDCEEQENMSLGAGGTLLRKAVKNSLSKKCAVDSESIYGQRSVDCDVSVDSSVGEEEEEVERRASIIEDELSSAFERSMSCMSGEEETLPLPPPPNTCMSMTSLDSIDILPPPPPEMCYGDTENHYHVSPITTPIGLPKPFPTDMSSLPPIGPSPVHKAKPPTLKKSNSVQKGPSSRRISFDDNVQMIEAPGSPQLPMIPKYEPAVPIRNNNPKKLTWTTAEAGDTNSLPRSFLDSLQKVMNKKWQVAEKCQANKDMTPHKVLGFRTDEPVGKVGQPNMYSKNSAIGAWVLETQMYAHQPQYYQEDSPPQLHRQNIQPGASPQQLQQHIQQHQLQQHQLQQHQLQQQQLHQQHIQQQQKFELQQQHLQQKHLHHQKIHHQQYHQQQQLQYQHELQQQYGHSEYQVQTAQQYGQVHLVPELEDPYGHCHSQSPVILRDPEATYVDPSRMRLNKGKCPPPPPPRSEDTHLSNSAV